MRALAIHTLWRCVGRSGEGGYLHYDALKYDPFFETLIMSVPQPKGSKEKYTSFIAGARAC